MVPSVSADPRPAAIAAFVRGDPVPGFIDGLLAHADAERHVLWRAWWQAWDARGDAGNVRAAFHVLPAASQVRIYRAPETWSLLHGAGQGGRGYDIDLMSEWIEGERGRGWTALGDRRDGQVMGGLLLDGPVIDALSPAAWRPLNEIPGLAEPYDDTRAQTAARQVTAAFEILGQCSEIWSEAVLRLVATIVCRCDPTVSSMTSSTTRLALGRIVLRNAHIEDVPPAVLADALLHETVHILIDHAELGQRLLTEGDADIVSPWSARPLDANTFMQACYVWRALFAFWLKALTLGLAPEETCIRRMTQCARGFIGVRPIESLLPRGAPVAVRLSVAALGDEVAQCLAA
ncbi:aKG-HExxH-type peptide beta-hydroxylase [Asticcacaulis solisilvae]|uniref:aKG-HExxH-type peptide beta-hydroxylase n=1 Tax=Asticcacaulis solisilvae TaxID=1217274 RepID=UPI003FD7C902